MPEPQGTSVVVVAYKPRPGMETELLQLTREHLPLLREQGLATTMPETILMADDGTIIEVFEWVPGGAAAAHTNAAVGALWHRYFAACTIVPLRELPESAEMFASFRRLEL